MNFCDIVNIIIIILAIMNVLTPIIYVINAVGKVILRILKVNPDETAEVVTEDELRIMINESLEDGEIETEEQRLIHKVFNFSDALVKEVMVPRVDVVMVEASSSLDTLLETYSQGMFTRMPVYEGSQDNIVGIINMKDIVLLKDRENFVLRDHLREAYTVIEQKKTMDLFSTMRNESISMAIVFDEYGTFSGIVSLEDLLEEIYFTKAYNLANERYSEFVGLHDLTCASDPTEFRQTVMNSEIIYANRSRDPSSDYYGTWQSTHSVVYDLEEKIVYLATQESGVYDEFILDIPVYKSGLQAYLNGKQDSLLVQRNYTTEQKSTIRNNIGAVDISYVANEVNALSQVARTGSYYSLLDYPTKLSQFQNNAGLATESFVNSSIATNTAYFRGTFNSLAELEANSGEVTNNDYAFVIVYDEVVPTEVKRYDRYKYSDENEEWSYEYTLNNSSFTAAQWASIQSGITSDGVSQIEENKQAILTKQSIPSTVQLTSPTILNLVDNTEYILTNVNSMSINYPSGNFNCWITLTTSPEGDIDISFQNNKHIGSPAEFGNDELWEISIKNGVYVAGKVETDEQV